MQYSKLGKSDLKVSRIGFGCMSLTGNTRDNELIVHKAIDSGINYFDTADLYEHGENEIRIGALLKLKRDQVVIATKVGNQYRADGNGWDWNPKKEYIITAVEGSLKRLQTDYIDLYQLHGGTIEDPIGETIEAFELLKEQGKIRFYGISSIRPNVIREYVKQSGIVSVMMQYSMLDRRPEESCLELLKKNEIGVLGRGSIAQGLLADKPAAAYLNWSAGQVAHAAAIVRSITKENSSPAQTAIRFVLQHQALSSAVMGIRTLTQLEDIAAVADFPPLSTEEMDLLRHALTTQYYTAHR